LAAVVDPRNAEHNHALGLHDPIQNSVLLVDRIGLDDGHNRSDDFMDLATTFSMNSETLFSTAEVECCGISRLTRCMVLTFSLL
jgi:hypothetical protein